MAVAAGEEACLVAAGLSGGTRWEACGLGYPVEG